MLPYTFQSLKDCNLDQIRDLPIGATFTCLAVGGYLVLLRSKPNDGERKVVVTLEELQQYNNAPWIRNTIARLFPPSVEVISVTGQPSLTKLPAAVCTLKTLKKLNLSGCSLAHLPDNIGQLSALEDLDLGNNKLTSLPEGIGSLTALRFFNAAHNHLESLPESIGNLSRLHRLGLKSNKLTKLPDSFGKLKSLVELYLTDNELDEWPADMAGLVSLVKLQASHNPDLAIIPAAFGELPKLELLRVACCNITTLPSTLSSSSSLTWFSIASNPLSQLPSKGPSVPTISYTDLHVGYKLGDGASGEVFECVYQGRRVALKVFLQERSPDGHSRDERHIACTLHHANLISAVAQVEEPLGLVMKYVDAKPLAQKPISTSLLRCRWAEGSKFSLEFVLRVALGVASALEHMHARNIAHGDVYAHNVLASDGAVCLCDYGASFVYNKKDGAMFEGQEVRAFGLLLKDLVMRLEVEFEGMEATLDCQKQLLLLISQCTTGPATTRPKFGDICKKIKVLQRSSLGKSTVSPRSDSRVNHQGNGYSPQKPTHASTAR